jgi:hypothetical protein
MSRTDQKGTKVTPTEHPAKTPSPRTGLFATLRAFLRGPGTGAPARRNDRASRSDSSRGREDAAFVSRRTPLATLLLTVALALALLAPAAASARFARPFLRQITGTTAGPFHTPVGLATDSSDNLWVGEAGEPQKSPFNLDQFAPAYPPGENTFLETLEAISPEPEPALPFSLAINRSTGNFYVAQAGRDYVEIFDSTGTFLSRFGPFGQPSVGVDNSAEPTAGSVYVSETAAVQKRDAAGVPVNFAGCPSCSSYVNANKITGYPGGSLNGEGPAIAVDSHANIYTTVVAYNGEGPAVLEYAPSGEFLRAFTGAEAPGLGEVHEGFGGSLQGIAADPNGDLLVSIRVESTLAHEGAIDEFNSSAHFLGQITEAGGSLILSPRRLTLDSHGDLYLVEGGHVDAFGEGAFVANLRLGDANPRTPTAATLNATVNPEALLANPEHAAVTECQFEYTPFVNDLQTVTLSGATGGTFALVFKTTSPTEEAVTRNIAFNAPASGPGSVQAALEGLPNIRAGNVEVSGPSGGPYAVEFTGSLAHADLPQLTADRIALTPLGATATVATTRNGGYDFSTASSAPCTPPPAQIPADESFHAVHADLTGLTSGLTYAYRLSATLGGAHGGNAKTAALAFTPPDEPRIESTFADNISSTFADLHAKINPLGAATTYQFQYLTQAHYEQNGNSFAGPNLPATAPASPAALGEGGPTGSSLEAVLQHLAGLAPATAYRFRAVASNVIGATIGPEATFATLSAVSPGPPDGRAFELLTPPGKGAAQDMFGRGGEAVPDTFENIDDGVSSESGDQFLLETLAAFGPFPASGRNAYVFSRTPSGWQTTSLASPSLGVQSLNEGVVFDPADFSRVALNDDVGSTASEAGQARTSLTGPAAGPYTTLHVDQGSHGTSNALESTRVLAGSRDLGHLVLETASHTVCPGAEPETHQDQGADVLCEYSGGELTLLDVNATGALLSPCGAVLGAGRVVTRGGEAHNAVSADGSRIFFTAPDPSMTPPPGGIGPGGEGCWNGKTTNAPQLYLRSEGQTVEVSAPEPGAGETKTGHHHPATYVGASLDGSRVFFVSEAELTVDDAAIHDPELYEYNTETAQLTRVSHGESGLSAAGVRAVIAVSADGSAVYFLAAGVLAAGASPTSCQLETTCNLYRYDTASGATAYVAPVAPFTALEKFLPRAASNYYTTPDGRYLLFATTSELTGYPTAAAPGINCITAVEGTGATIHGPCNELYRYDSATSSLLCVSCNPSGAPPTSNSEFARSALGNSASGPVRALSNDGSYAFFDTADALVPQDGNGVGDVYQWHNGALSLISSGHDSAPSFFLGASPDGRDVFLGTHSRLVPQDTDTLGDLYDARIGGGFPSPPGIKPCEGDACSTPVPAPNDPTPSSLSFQGAGNITECPKGKVKRSGKCVKKHHKHHKKHKRSQKRAANTNRRASR